MKLYLDGEIRQWYSRGDGQGVIFLIDAKTVDEARAVMEPLPLSKENLMDHEYILVGPLLPLGGTGSRSCTTGWRSTARAAPDSGRTSSGAPHGGSVRPAARDPTAGGTHGMYAGPGGHPARAAAEARRPRGGFRASGRHSFAGRLPVSAHLPEDCPRLWRIERITLQLLHNFPNHATSALASPLSLDPSHCRVRTGRQPFECTHCALDGSSMGT
jgi:hypothetical protein